MGIRRGELAEFGQQRVIPLTPTFVARPVDPEWKCQEEGDCCEKIPEVVMTKEEMAVLVHVAPKEITLHFRPIQGNFVALKAEPCPLHVFGKCLVYASRPYNCRRYACLRPDPKSEPFERDGGNFLIRYRTSRVARRMLHRIQRKAQGWAQAHGWNLGKGGDDHAKADTQGALDLCAGGGDDLRREGESSGGGHATGGPMLESQN